MISIKVNNQLFSSYNRMSLDLIYDTSGSSFAFESVFNPENNLHQIVFNPLNFDTVELLNDEQLLLTGVSINTNFKDSKSGSFAQMTGYSNPGSLDDISIPVENFPLQFVDLSLAQITDKLISPYGLIATYPGNAASLANENISEVTTTPGKSIRAFLAEIASQKGLIMRHDESGNVVFSIYEAGSPVASFREGQSGVLKFEANFNGQRMHSSITVMGQSSLDKEGQRQSTVENSLVNSVRPFVKNTNIGEDTDTENTAKQTRSLELKQIMASVTIDKIDLTGRVIMPGDVVTVQNRFIKIENETRFMVLKNSIKIDAKGESSTLSLILEDALTGNQPVKFWQ